MKSKNISKNHFILMFLGGVLGGLAWLVHPIFAFLMWQPLLWIEKDFRINNDASKSKYLKYYALLFKRLYIFFFTWNTLAAFWLVVINWVGGVFALLVIPALMTLPILIFHWINLQKQFKYSLLLFIVCWLTYEFLQHQWDLAWVWLTLGNSLASVHFLVQWYEYTGVLGGSLWILGANVLIFHIWQNTENRLTNCIFLILWLLLPACLSLYLYFNYLEKGKLTEIVVVQPDIDPYTEKFQNKLNYIPIQKQNERLIRLTKSQITTKTDLVLFPESATGAFLVEKELKREDNLPFDFKQIIDSLKDFPNANVLIGFNTYDFVEESEKNKPTVMKMQNSEVFYRKFNAAVFYQKNQINQIYHKSILVPGGEIFPFVDIFKKVFFFYKFKGIITTQKNKIVFHKNNEVKFAPLICYESTFGRYVGDYIKKGATVLCVMTNDAFWQGTPEPKQHLLIDRLRAIEYRRSIARSSHHGYSGFINQKGDFLQLTQTQIQTAIKGKIQANNEITFYAQNGDLLGRMAFGALCLFLLIRFRVLFSAWKR